MQRFFYMHCTYASAGEWIYEQDNDHQSAFFETTEYMNVIEIAKSGIVESRDAYFSGKIFLSRLNCESKQDGDKFFTSRTNITTDASDALIVYLDRLENPTSTAMLSSNDNRVALFSQSPLGGLLPTVVGDKLVLSSKLALVLEGEPLENIVFRYSALLPLLENARGGIVVTLLLSEYEGEFLPPDRSSLNIWFDISDKNSTRMARQMKEACGSVLAPIRWGHNSR